MLMILFTGYLIFCSYVDILFLLDSADGFWGGLVRLIMLLSFIVVNDFCNYQLLLINCQL